MIIRIEENGMIIVDGHEYVKKRTASWVARERQERDGIIHHYIACSGCGLEREPKAEDVTKYCPKCGALMW